MSTYIRDLPSNVQFGLTIPPQTMSANTNGTVVDLLTSDGRCQLVVGFGLVNSLTNTAVQVKESTDNTTFNSISGALITVLNTSSPANTTQSITFDRTARYVRADYTLTGGTTSINTVAYLLEQKKQV